MAKIGEMVSNAATSWRQMQKTKKNWETALDWNISQYIFCNKDTQWKYSLGVNASGGLPPC